MNSTSINDRNVRSVRSSRITSTLVVFMSLAVFQIACDPQVVKTFEQSDMYLDGNDAQMSTDQEVNQTDISFDQMINLDAEITDAELPEVDMSGLPEALPMPQVDERAFLQTSNGLIVVWRFDQRLYRAELTQEELEQAQEDLSIQAEPWFDLAEIEQASMIKLVALESTPPYFLVSTENQESFALRADLVSPEKINLGIKHDLLVAKGDGGALVLGSLWQGSEPADENESQDENDSQNNEQNIDNIIKEAPLAWRFTRDGNWSDLSEDHSGVSKPTALSRGLGSWILATEQGQCHMLNEQSGLHHAWYCHSQPNSVLLSDDFEVKVLGRLLRSSEDTPRGIGLWMWSGTPGRSVDPLFASIQSQAETPVARLATDEALSLADGTIDRWLIKSEAPQVLMVREDTQWSLITAYGKYNFEQQTAEEIFGLIENPSNRPSLLYWNENTASLSIKPLEESEWTSFRLPSVAPEDELCLVSPERCDAIDHDCDGQPQNQLCCVQGDAVTSRLSDVLFPDYNWFTGDSEIGALVMVASQNSARLFSFSTNGGEATLRTQWADIKSISHFSNYLSLVSAIGHDQNGQAYLLQNQRINDEWVKLALPCQAHAISVLDANHTTRVYCADKALLYNIDQELPVEETYPEASAVQWMTPWLTGTENLGEQYWLVALGEFNQLSLWKGDLDGIVLGESETTFLPSALGWLTPDDRSLPIQLPPEEEGLMSRIVEQNYIELWIDGLGWSPLGGHRWPLWASLSHKQAIAISVGYDEDPAEVQDSFLQRVNVRLHSLHEDTVYFGESIKERISKDSFGGAHIANYDAQGSSRPNLIHLLAGSLELSNAVCSE